MYEATRSALATLDLSERSSAAERQGAFIADELAQGALG